MQLLTAICQFLHLVSNHQLVKRGKFSWQLLWTGQHDCAYKNSYSCLGTTGTKILIAKSNCASALRTMCQKDSQVSGRQV
jgi:hypothetical protein